MGRSILALVRLVSLVVGSVSEAAFFLTAHTTTGQTALGG